MTIENNFYDNIIDIKNNYQKIDRFQHILNIIYTLPIRPNTVIINEDNQDYCKIYLLANNINGKIYIGQTWMKSLKARMGREGENYINSTYLYNAIKKYGVANFKYTLLDWTLDQKEADWLENFYILVFDSKDHDIGYNIKHGGSAGKHSEETKQKISKSSKGENSYWFGKHLSKEAKAKISIANTGRPKTPEECKHHSEAMKEKHKRDGHPMQGKHHTEEAKQKISDAYYNREQTEKEIEYKQYRKENKGKIRRISIEKEQSIINAYVNGMTFVEIRNMINCNNNTIYRVLYRNNIKIRPFDPKTTMLGKKHSEESKAKMSEIKQQYWDQKKSK